MNDPSPEAGAGGSTRLWQAVGANPDSEAIEARRDFLKLFALSLGVGQLGACARAPDDPIVPAVRSEQARETTPEYFATALERDGYGCGVLVKNRYGHPVKIEGNSLHPASLGATDIFSQAAIYGLWDPERSRNILKRGQISTWSEFRSALDSRMPTSQLGVGLHILSETSTSPTLSRLRGLFAAKYPGAQWHAYGSLPRDNVYEGARFAFGRPLETYFDFSKARVVLALDADFLGTMPGALRYARDFARAREVGTRSEAMRLYVAESSYSGGGALADHRWALSPRDVERLTAQLLDALTQRVDAAGKPDDAQSVWVRAVARDLEQHAGASVVVAGDHLTAATHHMTHLINQHLGNVGATVFHTEPLLWEGESQLDSLRSLHNAIAKEEVKTLLILGGNPAYTAPVDVSFGDLIDRVPWSAHLALYDDETSLRCDWHVPMAHELESWGDVYAFNGATTIQQPVIAPLYAGKSLCEFVSILLGVERTAYEIVSDTWRPLLGTQFDTAWTQALIDGVISDSSAKTLSPGPPKQVSPSAHGAEGSMDDGCDFLFRADATIGDGRHAANAWLQELPKPITQLTWDNAALISPAMASRLQLQDEDVVELCIQDHRIDAVVLIAAGHADGAVTLPLGYGRTRAGRIGNGSGFNAGRIRTTQGFWQARGQISKLSRTRPLAITQRHHRIERDDLVRVVAASQLDRSAQPDASALGRGQSLYPDVPHTDYAWGMSINLNACLGCKACTIACQAENNIPTVGREQVRRGREMHWIRVDGYYEGAASNPRLHFQPVPCMHCERAPCEVVCPVGATVHDHEGLNLQVYNRCIGTRFCANNCPYKVRRFNFLQFTDNSIRDYANPDVTVRNRGVMEKCTYCIQRIEKARIETDKQVRRLHDGEVVTACQAACPTAAIVFGDIGDPASAVAKAKADARNYALLAQLNTAPRTTYLAKVVNPNPELGS